MKKMLLLSACVFGMSCLSAGMAADRERLEKLMIDLATKPGSMAEFERMAAEARKEGMPEFDIAGAALANAVSLRDTGYLAKNLEPLARTLAAVSKEKLPKDYLVYQELGRALLASRKGDRKTEEAAFKEAFWIAPDWGKEIGSLVEEVLAEERWKEIRVPMDQPALEGSDGPESLAKLAADKKAVLIYFWAVWCDACQAYLPDFAKQAKEAGKKPVRFLAVNVDLETREKAGRFVEKNAPGLPAYTTDEAKTLPRLLDFEAIPTAALISADGEVLFLGHPQDPGMVRAMDAVAGGNPEVAAATGR